MAIGVFSCGVVPFLFRRKISSFQEEDARKSRRLHNRMMRKLPSMLVPKRSKAPKGSNSGVKTPKGYNNSSGVKEKRSSTFRNSCGVASNFRVMTEIRNKILTLRDLLDLSPCDGSESANELLTSTLRDLHKLFPSISPNFSLSRIDGTAIHEKVRCFGETLKSIGEMWTGNDKWMVNCKENSKSKLNDFEYLLALLEDINKLASEKMFDMTTDEDEEEDATETEDDQMTTDRSRSPSPDHAFEKDFSESYSSNNTSLSSSPTSVLPSALINDTSKKNNANASSAAPHILSLRVQAVGKLNPIEVNHLSFHMFPNVTQDSNLAVQLGSDIDEHESNKEAKQDCEFSQACEIMDLPEILLANLENISENNGIYWTGESNGKPVPARVTFDLLLTPSTISRLRSNVTARAAVSPSPRTLSPKIKESKIPTPPPPPSPPVSSPSANRDISPPSSPPGEEPITSESKVAPPPPPPLPPVKSKSGAVPPPPSPPPIKSENGAVPPAPLPPPIKSENRAVPPPLSPPARTSETVHSPKLPRSPHKGLKGKTPSPPPPPTSTGKGAAPPPPPKLAVPAPPPPMGTRKEGAPPPPPPVFAGAKNPRHKKTATKLKRSPQIGNLYRALKGKVEGSSQNGKSNKGNGKFAAPKGEKQGMADALAEMTRRSAYFQQIEEDVKNHAKTIRELKKAIATFQTSDMSELIRFHRYVESHLEKLTDESQVLARFEDFPSKKLEALRMAGTLYSKLDSIACTLQNWPMDSPIGQLLGRAERYFNKIKGDLDALERTKDEESKKFKTQKIHFDFSILVRIKELMVDVSSNCMELALKEKKEALAREKEGARPIKDGCKKESSQLLWKAFQFAFRVYTFAGGHDERAEKLTKELAQEIETDVHP